MPAAVVSPLHRDLSLLSGAKKALHCSSAPEIEQKPSVDHVFTIWPFSHNLCITKYLLSLFLFLDVQLGLAGTLAHDNRIGVVARRYFSCILWGRIGLVLMAFWVNSSEIATFTVSSVPIR